MNYMRVLWLFSVFIIGIRASTHWMVTEKGLIQPRLDSPFEMVNPYDLLAFLNQDTRWDNIVNLYHDLSKRKDVVRKLWADLERDSNVQNQIALDKNCIKAGSLNLLDWYTSLMEDGKARNIPEEEFKLYNPFYGLDTDVPDCKKISSLTFSMFAFEHLETMIQRENLTANPELSLPEQISPVMNLDQFGHWVAGLLRQNSSSWLHYNMASLYWRVKGNAPKAVECSRRAVHYAPRQYKDIALLSMGTIFHRSKRTEDAIIILNAAVDHEPHYSANHFVLANAYAVLGDFNVSLIHYELCLKSNPRFELAKKHKNGMLCHRILLEKLKTVQDLLDKLRVELVEYSQREAHWLKSQASFLRTMKHNEEFDYRNVEKNCEKMAELTGLDMKELKKEGDKNSLIQYFLDGPMYSDKWEGERGVLAVESAYSLQRLVKHIDKHADMVSDLVRPAHTPLHDSMIKKEIGPMPEFADNFKGTFSTDTKDHKTESHQSKDNVKTSTPVENEHSVFEGGIVLYPTTMKIHRNLEDFDKDPEWPSNKFCLDNTEKFPRNLDLIYPVFLPFENKGLRVNTLLTDMIGVPAESEHELPWHPPICPQESSSSSQKKNQKPQITTTVISTNYLNFKLLEYVGNGNTEVVKNMQQAEIGQRIYAAMQMELAPKWILYTLSSLYWRVKGNNQNAITCLLTASKSVPMKYKDVVYTSLASVYLEMGHFDEAMAAAEESFKLSLYEPATNFVIAQLNMVKRHRNTQLFHLKQVLRVQPMYMGGVVRGVLHGWACFLHQPHMQEFVDFGEGDICTQVEPGVSMVCEKGGTNCHVANIHCFNKRPETSNLVRMLELKGNNIHQASAAADHIDDTIFDEFIDNMPAQRTDIEGHQKNFDKFMSTIDSVLKGCGERGCGGINAEDLVLREDDCMYQHLQMGFWLHIINFKKLLVDANIRIPLEISSMTPADNEIPTCSMVDDVSSDFFLSRLSRVDTEHWQPMLGLMHQFADAFNLFDYVTLGKKVSAYVNANPRDWIGALAAAWWCGAGGHGVCCIRCLIAAAALVAQENAREVMLSATQILHMQSKIDDAKDLSYLSLYFSPKNKLEAFLVAVSHSNMFDFEQAVWMYRYSLSFDDKFVPSKVCLHATKCLMLFGEAASIPLSSLGLNNLDGKLE